MTTKTEKPRKAPQKDKGWRDIPIGGLILEPGSSLTYKTGSWRSRRPIHDPEKCINCMRCWILCPDDAIIVEDGKVTGINLDYCKGCGICAFECPKKVQAIEMVLESEAQQKDDKK